VLAAWLAGSFGRGDADEFSDVDLLVVIGDEERGAFLPGARRLYAQLGLDWPEEFERATLTHLERQLGLRIDA